MTTAAATAQPLPCGAWPSPLSPERAAASAVSLSYPGAAAGTLYWIEGRPAEQGRSVLMAQRPSGEVLEVSTPGANVRSRVHEYGALPWTAVGQRLVYPHFDDQQLRVLGADGDARVLTPAGCRYGDGHAMPDQRHLLCVREDHRQGGEARSAVVMLDLDQAQDEGRVLWAQSDFVAAPRVSADGKWLAFVSWDHPAMPWDASLLRVGRLGSSGLTDLHIVAGGPDESVQEPEWGADGSLYFISDRSGWWNLYRWREGQVQALTTLEAELSGPLWQLGQQSYTLVGDQRAVLCVNHEGRDQLWWLDLNSLDLTLLPLPFVGLDGLGRVDEHHLHALASSVTRLPELIRLDLRDGSVEVVRSAGEAPLATEAVSAAQAIEFVTAPGPQGEPRTAHAWFYPPQHPAWCPVPGELPPLLVMLHGGPTAQARPAFKVGVQFWTSRGFAVVDVNYGGSTGYGRAYRERLRGQWGVIDLQDAVAAIDHLVASGAVDGQRVVIRGGSAGGFTVLAGLAFTQRFAAGINYFGVADLETLAADTHKFESRYLDNLVAPLPEGQAIYRERSPLHHMARCRAALLTLQGSDDRVVPPAQSRQVVAAARAAGCPVAYLEFEGEGHGFRQAANIVRAQQAELVFLGRVLGFTPDGELPGLDMTSPGPR